jgi:hypothetical protein
MSVNPGEQQNEKTKNTSWRWRLIRFFGEPLLNKSATDNTPRDIGELLLYLERRLRANKSYRFKMIVFLTLSCYIPLEIRKSFENGQPQKDNIIALMKHWWYRPPEKREKIRDLFK